MSPFTFVLRVRTHAYAYACIRFGVHTNCHCVTVDLARNVTRFYLANLPADSVPKWDFSATAAWGGPNRDTSAAAITASGLLELHGYTGEQAFLDAARAALAALVGVGYALPEASGESLLTRCFHDCGDDECAIVEADYYLVEALLRAEKLGVRL